MFGGIRKRLESMRTIRTLCQQAELHARREAKQEPGAEHFLLAALDLPDGTARVAFAQVGANAASFGDAIARQYDEALRHIGIEPPTVSRRGPRQDAGGAGGGLYHAAASGKQVMQALAASHKDHAPLLGAHVVAVVADMEHGVAARALEAMGVDRGALKRAAEDAARA
ncbi:Clp protease N-terminal domain-containing protein [Stappia sp. MMSF_3263]|uniref:Clp protease N-terminal domain-containing protein n=1 Tax=Stappia sp. MMSF_3263 TaxID=3046693 RepID=UPI00273EB1A8|nr:Clp protease N-terminal domain-containing protein [Stappia sp. MMSF_3263]